jgi:DNA-binding HxlR family transcriptional regulator
MPTSRSYGDACGMARALDIVGERWAILVVRELLLGPQRFSELRRSLPHASSNLLSDRLRELQEHGVIRRRRLGPPAASWVYELTDLGRELDPILIALGNWGLNFPVPAQSPSLSGSSVLLYLRSHLQPKPGMAPVVIAVDLDDQVWAVQVTAEDVTIEPGEAARSDVIVRSDPARFDRVLHDPASLDAAMKAGRVQVAGDVAALRRVLRRLPAPA